MFITFEGIEGSGKSTQIAYAADYLARCGRPTVVTKEPGGTRIGAQIRAILLDPVNIDMDPGAELFLYAADRRQHISEVIRPALESGKTVICDRFHDSTIAYQGFSRQLDGELIQTLNRWVLDGLSPDMTFLLDLEPSVGLARAWQEVDQGRRAEQEMRFEREALSFHRNVRQGYLELARKEPDRFVVINAAGDKNRVWTAVQAVLESRARAGQEAIK